MKLNVVILLPLLLLMGLGVASGQTLFHLNDVEKPPKPLPSSTLQNSSPDVLCSSYKDMLAKLILKFLERLRSKMDTGIPSLGIPALDPLQIQNTSFHEAKSFQYEVDGTLANSIVEGLKTFNVTHISTSFLHLQANLSVTVPYFLVTGRYNLRGTLLSVLPVKGNGPYLLSPSNLLTNVTTQLHLDHGHLQITSMNFLLQISDLYVKFEGLYGGGHFGSFLNQIMNRWGVAVFRRIESKVHEQLRVALITVINEKLKEISLSELIGIFEAVPACKRSLSKSLMTRMEGDHLSRSF